ncbi:MAG: DUF1800 domain-containing protein [Thiothrix sp.]|nr:DUF1800 domain-containing protein [Thiothrix sp.]HPQ94749.1 DUF1800 domain-containing protein [Thiolinea sp.]
MILENYSAARHLGARLEMGTNDALCEERIGSRVDQVLSSLTPPVAYLPAAPTLTPWEAISGFQAMDTDERRAVRTQARQECRELTCWWLQLIHETPYPLLERMTLFWHNHFTSNADSVAWPQLMYRQNQLFRTHALGNFANLLQEIVFDPAMLRYLDGASNAVNSPNENFARELLELFTLGEGHYTERDIVEAARSLTGWQFDYKTGKAVFKVWRHDKAEKTFLGETGNFNSTDIINIILRQPRTAEFIAEKFWAGFINPEPPDPAIITQWARTFRESGYEITALLSAVVQSQPFWDGRNRGALIKSPVEFSIGLLRELKTEISDYEFLRKANLQLGQNLFYPPDVKGWRGGFSWISNTTLTRRHDLISKLTTEYGNGLTTAIPARMLLQQEPAVPSPKNLSNQQLDQLLAGLFARFTGTEAAITATATATCNIDVAALEQWLLPLPSLSRPDCHQPLSDLLFVLMKDPAYQLR